MQQGITTLSVAPALSRELAATLLGADPASAVVGSAVDMGILVERGDRLDLHPLARAFLKERVGRLGLAPAPGAVETCISHYRLRGEWDAAFDTAANHASVDELEALMRDALPSSSMRAAFRPSELGTTSRLTWVFLHRSFYSPGLRSRLRLGRLIEAISSAQSAAEREREIAYRAMSIAGTAAHLASREEDARAFFGRAEAVATTESERRDASWGELTCLIDLEDPRAHAALDRLSEGISLGQPREFVRAAAHHLYLQIRQGGLDLEQADTAYEVLPTVEDPLVVSSFLSGYAMVLGLSARYEDGLLAGAGPAQHRREVSAGLCASIQLLRHCARVCGPPSVAACRGEH